MSLNFDSGNFDKDVIEASKNKPVLVDFFAEWCGPCRTQGPIVDELASEMGDKAVVGKLNIENSEDVAGKFGVMSIPTILIFRNGEVKESFTGIREKSVLKENLEKHL